MSNRLAIMDYGVGGLDLYKRIKTISPDTGITYFSDSGTIPYGKLSKEDLSRRVKKVIRFLKSDGDTTVIVACHSASSVALELKGPDIIDLIRYTQNSSLSAKEKYIGIIGGGRTIRSQLYSKYFRSIGHNVTQRIAQPLSILIEKGEVHGQNVSNALNKVLKPIMEVDALILACTHYPVLRKEIQTLLGMGCKVIDPIDALLNDIEGSIGEFGTRPDIFYTTGNQDLMVQVAKTVYNIDIKSIKPVNL